MMKRDSIYIDGEWRIPRSKTTIPVISPSTEEIIGSAPDANADDVADAVLAARRAFDHGPWPRLSISERVAILGRAIDSLEPKIEEIARLVSSEMGLPFSIGKQLQPGALGAARYFLSVAADMQTTELRLGSNPAAVLREPVGVVASIAPWNGPFFQAVTKLIPALVTGCTMVFKPSAETSLDVYYLIEALAAAGVPNGAINLITGGRDTGRSLVAHPGIDKVSFTGSTVAGREIGAVCGREFKRMQLELGGKSAAIICEDADLAVTMSGLAMGCFFNTGQVCAAFSRVLAPRSRYDEIVAALCKTAESFVVGDPFDAATTMGPLVTAQQRDRVESYIAAGIAEGAQLLTGGKRPPHLDKGWYIQPTVFGGVTNDMKIAREEIFGPVTAVIAYDTLDEAIAIANDSDYGLHGGVFTQNDEKALQIAKSVRSGSVSVNAFVYNLEAPFGGVKCSGVGRDTGREAVEAYFELKTINITPSMKKLFQS
jgi:acyl-CoA reductase-like NAD-dependent aldehyde dehydrogenase